MKFKLLKAAFMSLVLSASSSAFAGVIALDDWFDYAGTNTGGLTQSQVSDNLYYAVALDLDFSTTDTYEVAAGWHIASANEWYSLYASYVGSFTGYHHYDNNGWDRYTSKSGASNHYYFALAEMFNPSFQNQAVHAGNYVGTTSTGYGDNLYYNKASFAGLMVIKDGAAEWETRSEVPEPTTLAIFALGMIGLASRRFKKQ